MPDDRDFISLYLDYTSETECPTFFHRWTAVTTLSAYLGRNVHFKFGHFTLYPNLYVMLMGSPGTKKSSAIKIGAKILKQAGYKTFAAKKTRQEKFLLDLAEQSEIAAGGYEGDTASVLEQNLFGDTAESEAMYEHRPPAECFIAADEFNNFLGVNNLDFASLLGELWDYEGVYDHKLKNSKSVYIPHPTITMLGGNTPTGLAACFPVEAMGQGFFSRLLLVYGEPSGVKYTFPPAPDTAKQAALVAMLEDIKQAMHGEMVMSDEAKVLLDKIYKGWEGIEDIRFEHYANRRLTHLIKLCLVVAASRISKEVNKRDVVEAHTLLSFTERLMPKALGEFGKAKHSEVTHRVMCVIDSARTPISVRDIWVAVHQDLDSRNQLMEILANLTTADKIQSVGEGALAGYLPIRKVREKGLEGTVDWSLLTTEERGIQA